MSTSIENMQWMDIGETAIRYELRPGVGEPLVLIHELGGSLNSWDHLLPLLDSRRPMLRYDARGFGMSEKLRDVPCIEDLANDLRHLLDELGMSGPVAVISSAVGCAIAAHFAAHHPQRVSSIVALSPVTEVAVVRRMSLLGIADRMEREGLRAMVDTALATSYPPALINDLRVFRQFRARWMNNDPTSFALSYRMLADLNERHALGMLRCPVLIVAGLQDQLRPPEMSREVAAQIAGAKLMYLDTGHFMHVQSPIPVAAAALSFIDSGGREPGATVSEQ